MTESARAAEAAAINRTAAIQASLSSLLFETLGVFRVGDTATQAEKMAAADDFLARTIQAIETQFDRGMVDYALARYTANRKMEERKDGGQSKAPGGRVAPGVYVVAETPAEMVIRRQGQSSER